jgi:TPR repeat protein
VKWFQKAAEQGHAKAQRYLGYCYQYGQGLPKDLHKAVDWYRKAADQGEAVAQCVLGNLYEEGEGVIED